METIEWTGEYQNCESQKDLKSTGPLTDTAHVTRLNAQEQRELQGRMEKKQMKEFMTVSLDLSVPFVCPHQGTPFLNFSSRLCSSYVTRCTRGWSRDALTTV